MSTSAKPVSDDKAANFSADDKASAGAAHTSPTKDSRAHEGEANKADASAGVQTLAGEKKQPHHLTLDEHKIPQNNLPIVLGGLMCTVFLAALDQTIVSTALPSIVASLGGGPSGFTWVASAYLLTATCLLPCWARLSDLTGRKVLLWIGIFVFVVGSILCGAAQSMTMLCISRGVQGVGGGCIVSLCQIILGDITPLAKRGTYQGLFGLVWSGAAVSGPLMGGAIAGNTTWRWCFFINIPVSVVAFVILFMNLKLNPTKKRTLRDVVNEFDKIGYTIFLAAIVVFLLGFVYAEIEGFGSARAIALLVSGTVCFVAFVAWEFYAEKRWPNVKPIIPPRLFRTRTTVLILVSVACHGLAFFAATYYIPYYFQILGSSPIRSAVQQLPFSLVSALASFFSGLVITHTRAYRPVLIFGFVVYTLGQGLMILLDADSSVAVQEITILIAGIGLGCLFATPMVALNAAMPHGDMASTTSSLTMVRSTFGTVGIAVAASIFAEDLKTRTASIQGYVLPENPSAVIGEISKIMPLELRREVTVAYADSIQKIWIVLTPIVGVGLLAALGVKGYSLQRKVVNAGETVPVAAPGGAPVGDIEKGEPQQQQHAEEEADVENATVSTASEASGEHTVADHGVDLEKAAKKEDH